MKDAEILYRPLMAIEDRQKEVDARFGQAFGEGHQPTLKRSRHA